MLDAKEAEIVALREELDETNKGVVALYAELDDKAADLREATELKSRFLSYMSHEFRTPLTSISQHHRASCSRVSTGPLTPEQLRQVEFVRGSARELTDMVGDLLDSRKSKAGQHHDLARVVRARRPDIRVARHVQTHRREHEHLADVRRTPRATSSCSPMTRSCRRSCATFISNALKFTTEGEVRVTGHACCPG
jgi:signal transduction histidine kinase